MRTPPEPITVALAAVAAGSAVSESLAAAALSQVMQGGTTPAQAAGLLMGLRARGETAEELAGVVRALRDAMQRVELGDGPAVIDTCGTGGGAVGTFNISTAAAFVAVGAGARVAKHGNRSYTSQCGSADVLEALGVGVATDPAHAARLLERSGMVFLFAPAFHPAMKHLAPIRRELGVTTIMNLAGPLANPASVRRQVVGVADANRAPVVAGALARLRPDHALVVHARVGMDEIAPEGLSDVWEVQADSVHQWTVDPADYDLTAGPLTELAGGPPRQNAARIERLLRTPTDDPVGRSTVILNAGAAIYVAGLASTYRAGLQAARAALDGGAAATALATLVGTRGETGLSTSE